MQSPPRQPPRFVPTLTTVVDIPTSPAAQPPEVVAMPLTAPSAPSAPAAPASTHAAEVTPAPIPHVSTGVAAPTRHDEGPVPLAGSRASVEPLPLGALLAAAVTPQPSREPDERPSALTRSAIDPGVAPGHFLHRAEGARYTPVLTEVVVAPEVEPITAAKGVDAAAALTWPDAPSFVPTTAERAATPQAPNPVDDEAIFQLEESLLHRVLQRVDLSLEERLTEVVSTAVQQQLDAMIPQLRAAMERALRQLVVDALAHELSDKPESEPPFTAHSLG